MLRVKLEGVVYTSMFDPGDGRKNWHDLLTGFCYAFRDVEDATLVLKMVKTASLDYRRDLFLLLARLKPYKCRVVTMNGFLEDADYDTLIASTTYYVNTSHCEGLCMPMMEFMSAGKPVVAPRHTAMTDYIDERAAFIVGSTPEHNVWPGDPRYLFTTMRERIRWDTLVTAYRESYRVAKEDPQHYAAMGRSAAEIMSGYCSDEIVREKLKTAMDRVLEIAREREEAQIAAAKPAPEQSAETA
jgi:glycosyltransferase involved in cell wall biosynthesis